MDYDFYKDFSLDARLHLEVKEEILNKRNYKIPYDSFKVMIDVDDIGQSDKVVLLGVTIED